VGMHQTELFGRAGLAGFGATAFTGDPRANRMGGRSTAPGPGFQGANGLRVVSDVVLPGDIQVTGDGTPFVLMPDCQTTGGYPRIASVLPCDMPIVAQAPPGALLRFQFVDMASGLSAERAARTAWRDLARHAQPLVRDPRDMGNLLAYDLISGLSAGDELEGEMT